MATVTIKLPGNTLVQIDERADDEHDGNRSAAIRELINQGLEYDELHTEAERLRRERRLILEQREEHTELVRTVERQQSLAERKAKAGVLTKTKWALFGMSDDAEEG